MPLWWLRGLIWIVLGTGVYAYGLISGHPLVLSRTNIPWGLLLVGLGLLLLAFDSWRSRRKSP